MKIVRFDDGTWALRKFSLFWFRWVYRDLKGGGLFRWRTKNDEYFHNCLADSEETLRKLVNKHQVVEEKSL